MRTVTQSINVYEFDELEGTAQERAVNDYIKYIMEDYSDDVLTDNMKRAVDKAEQMQTPWFVGEYIWEYAKEEVLELCRQYEYTENGKYFGWKGED